MQDVERHSGKAEPRGRAYALAVVSSAVAVGLRAILDEPLGNSYPFIFSFAAVALSAAYGGWAPALLALLLNYFACDWLFIAPRGVIKLSKLDDFVAFGSFSFTCGIITALAEGMRRARRAFESQAVELRRTNTELESERERLRVTLSSIGDAVIATDASGTVRFVNPIAEELTGWPHQAACGRPLPEVFRIVDEATRQPSESPVQKVLRDGTVVGLANHTVLIRKDGSESAIADTAAPIRARDGTVSGVILVFRDVSAERRAQTLLHKQNERTQLLSRTLQALLSAADPDTIVRELCPKVAVHVGADCYFNFMVNEQQDALRLHSCAGLSDEMVASIEQLQFGQAICGTVAQTRRAIVANDIQSSDYDKAALVRGYGIQSYACNPLLAGDHLLGTLSFASRKRTHFTSDELEFLATISHYVALALDRLQTERILRQQERSLRESQQRFQEVAENIPQLAWMTDQDGGLEWYNQRWFDYTGTTLEQMRGWGWQAVHHPDHTERVTAGWKRALEAGEKWEDTFPLRSRTGEFRWFLSRAFPIRDADGKITRWFGTNTDITELRDVQEALRQTQAELESEKRQLEVTVEQRTAKLTEALGDLESFSYSIAHDMRAPLRSMRGFAELLASEHGESLDAEGREFSIRIANSAGRLDRLIQDVLAYSKVLRGEISLEPIDPAQLTREIVNAYAHLQEPEAEIIIQEPMPCVRANPAALTQVVSNLLGNARKFVAPGVKPRITVRAENGGDRIRLWFEDNGIGIAPAARDGIFGMFQRAHSGNSYEGTGMGLAIVRKAVERMGGQVGVESEVNKGSRFWVELLAPAPDDRVAGKRNRDEGNRQRSTVESK
jgi:PAS domain S-box-containing protein